MSTKQRLARQSRFTRIPPEVSITAETHLDRRGRPYIYLSINYGDQQLFIVPKLGTTLDPDGAYAVTRVSPLSKERITRVISKKA